MSRRYTFNLHFSCRAAGTTAETISIAIRKQLPQPAGRPSRWLSNRNGLKLLWPHGALRLTTRNYSLPEPVATNLLRMRHQGQHTFVVGAWVHGEYVLEFKNNICNILDGAFHENSMQS